MPNAPLEVPEVDHVLSLHNVRAMGRQEDQVDAILAAKVNHVVVQTMRLVSVDEKHHWILF